MAWVLLLLAGACEVFWAIGLKKYGFSASWGTASTLAGMLLSFALLSAAMRQLPLGTAYATWTGIGAVGAAAFGMAFMNEPRDLPRVGCILLIVAGIVGLKVFTPAEAEPAGQGVSGPAAPGGGAN